MNNLRDCDNYKEENRMTVQQQIREDVLVAIQQYFQGEQWSELQDRVENDAAHTYHAHIFVDTRLHPNSFCDVLRAYYRSRGMEISRAIEFQPSNVGHNMLHCVYPNGSFHYDIAWKYSPEAVLAPMDPQFVKEKNNLQIWGEKEIGEFFDQYPFVQPDGQAAQDIQKFFVSDDWKQTRDYVLDKTIAHFHLNVEMSIHPDALRDAGLAAIKKEGWELERVIHCIFSPTIDWTAGKVVYLLKEPEVMFDIAWKYNGDVSLRASTVHFMLPDSPKFDVRRKEKMEFYTDQGDFITLTTGELDRLEQLFKQ